jgi:hypothetical protein
MKRFLTITTLVILVTLLILGINTPSNTLMLLAATTQDYVFVRIGLIMIVASLLIYQPPRSKAFRVTLAVVATALLSTGLWTTFNYEIKLFDALMLLEIAILLYLEAAELGVEKSTGRRPGMTSERRAIKVKYQTA